MGILSKIFSSGATELVKGVGDVLDNLTTSKEEKLAAELKVKELLTKYEVSLEQEVTKRWEADANSDSFMSKNIRPWGLALTLGLTITLVFIDAAVIDFVVDDSWKSLLLTLLVTMVGAYYGGRTYEKSKGVN
tara:strand:- start:6553 stop:6951 length:399 start_codon:yes stop_codon:yes gene_type:complete